MEAPPLPPSVAARRAEVAEALRQTAARTRFSNRRRRFDASFSDRRRSRALRRFAILSFLALFAIPGLVAGGYFGWLAADQYQAEARFVLEPNRAALSAGTGGAGASRPVEIERDTLIVVDYLNSRALVEALEDEVGLRARFVGPALSLQSLTRRMTPDWWAGLTPGAPVEDLLDFWEGVTDIDVRAASGIVTFRLRAFTPEDARDIAAAALEKAEALVNAMNETVWRDAVTRGETLLAEAAKRLGDIQGRIAVARDDEGVLDAEAAAALQGAVIAQARADLIALRRDRAAMLRSVSATAPQAQTLARRIASVEAQIARLEASMTRRTDVTDADERPLSDSMSRLEALETERLFAEKQFLAAAKRLEAAREAGRRRLTYLEVFERPALAQEARHPRRAVAIALTLGAGLVVWGVAVGLFSLIRHHIA